MLIYVKIASKLMLVCSIIRFIHFYSVYNSQNTAATCLRYDGKFVKYLTSIYTTVAMNLALQKVKSVTDTQLVSDHSKLYMCFYLKILTLNLESIFGADVIFSERQRNH